MKIVYFFIINLYIQFSYCLTFEKNILITMYLNKLLLTLITFSSYNRFKFSLATSFSEILCNFLCCFHQYFCVLFIFINDILHIMTTRLVNYGWFVLDFLFQLVQKVSIIFSISCPFPDSLPTKCF